MHLAPVRRQALLVQADRDHLHVDQQRAACFERADARRDRALTEAHERGKLEVGRRVDHPPNDLPFVGRKRVRSDLGVDDGEALILDPAAERGHLSHVVRGHVASKAFGATSAGAGARPSTAPLKSTRTAWTSSAPPACLAR